MLGSNRRISSCATSPYFNWGMVFRVENFYHIIEPESNDRAQIYIYTPRLGGSAFKCSRWNIWELLFLVALELLVELILMMRGVYSPSMLATQTG